jgi:DNA repair photolyase
MRAASARKRLKPKPFMNVVYEPRGRAREYSGLACNLYRGCTHGCRYCYAPACMRTTGEKWHAIAEPRTDILKLLNVGAVAI